jgi:fatty-acyl-CoA synthase
VRTVQFGTTRAPRGFVHALRAALPEALLITGYGTTECGPVTRAFGDDISADDDSQVGRPVPAASITVGTTEDPARGHRPREVGEIAIQCPWQMAGYVEAGRLVRVERIDPGDLGFFDDHGRLHIAGRTKEIVITGGQNVYPHEVERAFEVHPGLAEVAVYGAEDESWGERVELACVVKPGHEAPSLDELREFGHGLLARYKLPRRLVVLEALPMTANMKVDRQRLSRGDVDVLSSAEMEGR